MSEYYDRLKAALADRYAIERELGAGGMATVYLARDLKHDRLVAVKVLDPDLAASLGADRFLREIQVTAKLTHPHILPLYDSGEAGGFLYYVMPFVEGESLADRIAREKQLSIKEAVQITREVAEALALAHSYGLIHRDIKPQNIMMSGGHAIVADFGIATAVSQAGGEKITKTGMSVGTPAYMSPEQGMAADTLDGRADIYSLGCVLFEMLVGQIPFTGTTPQQIIARHSMDHVPPPHIMRDTIPDALEEVILRAMAKLPADRYRTAFEMAEALGAVDTATSVHRVSPTMQMLARRRRRQKVLVPAVVAMAVVVLGGAAWAVLGGRVGREGGIGGGLDLKRIAVLYFDDFSTNEELQPVADGLTEGLIEELAGVPGLRVVSRYGVAPWRASDVRRDSIARALQTGTLVVGSVEPAGGGRIAITTRLVDGASGVDVGRAARFVLPRDALLSARDSVAIAVSRILRERLGEEVAIRERRASTSSVAAWTLVQRAEIARKTAEQQASRGETDGALAAAAQAESLLVQAEQADPRWSEPLVLQAQLLGARGWLSRRSPERAKALLEAGLALAGRALERSPNDARALEARGTLRYRYWQLAFSPDGRAREELLEEAYQDLASAVRTDPSLATAHATLSHLHYQRKDLVAAMLAATRAYEADAYLRNVDEILDRLAVVSYDIANFREAQRWCHEGARRFPADRRFVDCQLWMLITPDAAPDVGRAWRLAEQLDSLTPPQRRPFMGRLARQVVACVLGRSGMLDSARSLLLSIRTSDPQIDPDQELVGYEAVMRSLMGDKDEAITLLKRYVATHPDHSFERGGTVIWWWVPLRDHPEFQQLLTVRSPGSSMH